MTKRRALAGGIKGDWLNDRDPTVHLKSAHVRKRESFTAREGSWAQITLPSGEVRRIPAACRATIGAVGNADHMKIRLGKAGRKRWMGRRPHVRGTAMNPNKHPMGGGEGRSKGHTPRSPTGVLAKGGKTRRRRKPSNAMIVRRRISVRYGQLKV
jgi:large subunit ribosomal protein L2